MSRRFINQLRENESVVEIYQMSDRFLRPNKNGNLYLQFVIADRTGAMDGRFWNAGEEMLSEFEAGCYVTVEGTVQRYQGTLQFIAKKITKANSAKLNAHDFARGGQVDIHGQTAKLKEFLRGMSDPDLLNLADCFLTDEAFMTAFCERPAGIKLHHATIGGLLEHTVCMMELARSVGEIYQKILDPDLLLMGVFLHDIGKIDELSVQGGFSYTDAGQILGHPFLGTELLKRKIEETERLTGNPFDPELAMLLTHLVISHHGPLENGSSKVPMTLEAVALHFIDSLDAKLTEFYKHLYEDPNSDSHWTNYIPGIERKLYKRQKPSPRC